MKTFIDPNLLQRLRVGPLAPYLDAYLKHIEQDGFLPSSAPMQMYAIARFSKWLRDRQFDLYQVDEAAVNRFLKRDPGVVHSCECATLRRLLAVLRELGVIVAKASEPTTCRERFLDDYLRYLRRGRGLAEVTLEYFVRFAEQFLSARFGSGDLNFSELCAKDVTDFVQNRASQLSPGRAKLLVTALRSLLRYMRHQGDIALDLARCVPPVAMWSLSTLPKFLPAGTVQQLLDHRERETARGKRNYAVLLLLARMGLRACEIVALELDDIDWDNGRITIHGKGGRLAQMPLPSDVGEAIASYLRFGRPCCTCRRVFLRHRASLRGFADSTTVSSIVRRALIDAGVDSARKGAHLFRHTLATDLLRQNFSLDEIGELLRHQSPNTTALYAKVDLTALRTLAPSLAGRCAMKTVREAVGDYLALRRSLGFKLRKHQRFLEEFTSFLEQESTSQITSRLALLWATQPQHIQPAEWAARLSVVRGFARYWSATDATTEVPPDGLLPYRPRRAKPYLYSDEQIDQLLETAKNMPAAHSLQPWTYHCLLGLLAVTGLRISEALNLRGGDIDWSEGVLTIRDAKFGKSRLVPLHTSSLKVLSDYAVRRNHLFASQDSGYFFPSRRGARLDEGQVRRTFYTLSRQIGIRGVFASRGPRLHDFRHRFAVQTLLHWHRNGEDVRRRLPVLSTYLGHAHVSDTYCSTFDLSGRQPRYQGRDPGEDNSY